MMNHETQKTIDTKQYQSEIQQVQCGASIKVRHHGCTVSKNSESLQISNKPKGVLLYCYACQHWTWLPHANNVFDVRRRSAQYEECQRLKRTGNYNLPVDFSHTLHPVGRAWLLQHGWTHELCKHYHIGYSEFFDRVIIPLYNLQGDYIGWTGRGVFPNQKPKYKDILKETDNIVFKSSYKYCTFHNKTPFKDCIVLVEDVLSAGRVGLVSDSMALLSTSTSTTVVNKVGHYKNVILWLDSDYAGKRGSKKLLNKIQWLTNVRVLCTPHDPKKYSINQIQRYLYDVCIQ